MESITQIVNFLLDFLILFRHHAVILFKAGLLYFTLKENIETRNKNCIILSMIHECTTEQNAPTRGQSTKSQNFEKKSSKNPKLKGSDYCIGRYRTQCSLTINSIHNPKKNATKLVSCGQSEYPKKAV